MFVVVLISYFSLRLQQLNKNIRGKYVEVEIFLKLRLGYKNMPGKIINILEKEHPVLERKNPGQYGNPGNQNEFPGIQN